MGFFDKFRRKREPEMPKALAELYKLLFPGGKEQQTTLTEQLCRKLGNRYDMYLVANNYVFVLNSLFKDEDKSLNAITNKVKRRPDNKLTDADVQIIYNHAIDNNEHLSQTIGLQNIMELLSNNGTSEDVMPEGYGEFGLDVTNPVPIHGIFQSEVYLKKLRLSNGAKISWERIGSCNAPNIEYIIDKYVIRDEYGQIVCYLYLCPYNRKTSEKAPKGFIFEGEKHLVQDTKCNKVSQGTILPSKGVSYVTDVNGEPMLVFYRSDSKVFVNRRLGNDNVGYFLNIRRPLLIDVTGKARIELPQMPSECDGIILKGYGTNSTAFIVKDFQSQTMEIPLEVSHTTSHSSTSSNEAYLLFFSASWCGPCKEFEKVMNEAGINNYTYIDVDLAETEELVKKYQVRNIPKTILVKTNGEIIEKWIGCEDGDPRQTEFLNIIRSGCYKIVPFNGTF